MFGQWKVALFLVRKNFMGKGLKKKRGGGGEEEPYASCSGLIQMLYKGHKMVLHLPGGVKGRNNIPQAAELKITLLRQIPSLTVLPRHKAALCFLLLEGQLCSSPVARFSLSFEKGFQSSNSGPRVAPAHSLPWPALLPACSPRKQPVFWFSFFLLQAWAAPL